MKVAYQPACIHETNHMSGFEDVHGVLCARCDRDAVRHVYLGYWCGNVCAKHSEQLAAGRYHEVDERLRGIVKEDGA